MWSSAKLFLKGDDRGLGWWQFVALPRVGELIAITIDEQPTILEVVSVVHTPIISLSNDEKVIATVGIIVQLTNLKTNTNGGV